MEERKYNFLKIVAIGSVIFASLILLTNKHYASKDIVEKGNIKIETFRHEEGWGYHIFMDDKMYIEQKYIPVISGKLPFKTKGDAENVARLMKKKIIENIIPPSISLKEIDSLELNQ